MGRQVLIVGAVGIALSLSGCVGQPVPEEIVSVHQVGDIITADEASEVASDPSGTYGVYETRGGTFLVVDPRAPLPESVLNEIRSEVSTLTDSAGSAFPDLIAYIGGIESTTMRPIVVVYSAIRGWDDPDRPASEQWFVATASNPSEALNNRDETARSRELAVAIAEDFIALNGGDLIIVS